MQADKGGKENMKMRCMDNRKYNLSGQDRDRSLDILRGVAIQQVFRILVAIQKNLL